MKKLPVTSYQLPVKLSLIIFPFAIFLLPLVVQAVQVLPACTATGNCGICDFLQTFVNIMHWIVGATGGIALFLMIWHAFGWIISGGSSEKIQKARQGIVHTIVAIIIILGAWQAINIIILLLMSDPGQAKFSFFSNNEKVWYQYCSQGKICQGRGDGSPTGNGKFCFKGEEMKGEEGEKTVLPCSALGRTGTETAKADNACEYWAKLCPDLMGGNNPYKDYKCEKKDDCDPYENLGTAYCPEKDKSVQACCLKKSETPAPNP